jgi:hypothetical protein
LLHAACLRVNLSALEWLLLLVENSLYFSLIAGAAVAYAVISRNVGIMVVLIIATPFLFLMLLALFNLNWPFGDSLEDQHLKASFQLVAQAFLSVMVVAIAMSWVAQRRIWLTAAGFLLCAAFLVAPGIFWKWNFVDELSQDATTAEIVSDQVAVQWIDVPRFISYSGGDNITYSKVLRPGWVSGLKNGSKGDLVKFKSEARFRDGTVLKSEGVTKYFAYDNLFLTILPQLGIDVAEEEPREGYGRPLVWTLFEYVKNRHQKISGRQASILGIGTFQLEKPVILAELPVQVGASAATGRSHFRINGISGAETQIRLHISIRRVKLTSLGDGARKQYRPQFLLVNPSTKEFASSTEFGRTSPAGGEWNSIEETFSINRQLGAASNSKAREFLKGARLYILGTRYGGNIELPYEIPEMLLEEKR